MSEIDLEDFREQTIIAYKESLAPLASLYTYKNIISYDNLARLPTIVFVGKDSSHLKDLIGELLDLKFNLADEVQNTKDILVYIGKTAWQSSVEENNLQPYLIADDKQDDNENIYKYIKENITYYPIDSLSLAQVQVVDLSRVCVALQAVDGGTDKSKKIIDYYLKCSEAIFVVSQANDNNPESSCKNWVDLLDLNNYKGEVFLVVQQLEYADKLANFVNFFAKYCFSYGRLLHNISSADIIVHHSTKLALRTNYDLSDLSLETCSKVKIAFSNATNAWIDKIKFAFCEGSLRLKMIDKVLSNFHKKKSAYIFKAVVIGIVLSLLTTVFLGLFIQTKNVLSGYSDVKIAIGFSGFFIIISMIWHIFVVYFLFSQKKKNILKNLSALYEIKSSDELIIWQDIEPTIVEYITKDKKFSKSTRNAYVESLDEFNLRYLRQQEESKITPIT